MRTVTKRPAVTVPTVGGAWAHLCLMKGMLMQLAAATAKKGTKRPMMGGRRWGRNRNTGHRSASEAPGGQGRGQGEKEEPSCFTVASDLKPSAVSTAPVVALT